MTGRLRPFCTLDFVGTLVPVHEFVLTVRGVAVPFAQRLRAQRFRGRILLTVAIGAVAIVGCRSPYYADQGAMVGGATGAGVGAVIGDASGNAGAGALIGGAIGAITGAAVGSDMDREVAGAIAAKRRAAVSIDGAIAMSREGLSEDVIIKQVRTRGLDRRLSTEDLIRLRQNEVADNVIQAMQSSPVATEVPPQPVVIREHYGYYDDHYYPPGHGLYRRRYRSHSPTIGLSLSRQ